MPAWVEQISANNLGFYGVAIIGVLVAIILIILIFRLLLGRRLRMQGSRQRLARLGIVDAFSIDRQRQLVIIRRDNIEHLILIGGPNDLLIESEIIRAEARDARDQRLREKDTREREAKDMSVVPAPNNIIRAPAAVAAGLPNLPPQPDEMPPLTAGAAGQKNDQGQAAASSQAQSLSAVPPLAAVQPAVAPIPPIRPLPRVMLQGSELPPVADGKQAAASAPGPALRPASSFTLPPRPNPFPVSPRRAPVTTPLPKASPLREAATGVQPEEGSEKPGMPKPADLGTKIEPAFASRPSFLRPPSGSPPPSPLPRPLPRAGSLLETMPPPSGQLPVSQPSAPKEEILEAADAASSKIPPVVPAGPMNLPANPPPQGPEPAVPAEHPAKARDAALPEPDTVVTEPKMLEEGKQLVEAEAADPLNSLEAEMAKLLGRE